MTREFLMWLDEKFNHPLVPMFFLLGCALLFVSLTIVYKDIQFASETELRYVSIAVGVACLALSVFLNYKPPRSLNASLRGNEKVGLNDDNAVLRLPASLRKEFSRSFSARKDRQNEAVKSLLRFIERETKHRERIPQEDFDKEFPDHVFWKLEVVVWMGFVEKEYSGRRRGGKPLFDYWLSPEYKRELGR